MSKCEGRNTRCAKVPREARANANAAMQLTVAVAPTKNGRESAKRDMGKEGLGGGRSQACLEPHAEGELVSVHDGVLPRHLQIRSACTWKANEGNRARQLLQQPQQQDAGIREGVSSSGFTRGTRRHTSVEQPAAAIDPLGKQHPREKTDTGKRDKSETGRSGHGPELAQALLLAEKRSAARPPPP